MNYNTNKTMAKAMQNKNNTGKLLKNKTRTSNRSSRKSTSWRRFFHLENVDADAIISTNITFNPKL